MHDAVLPDDAFDFTPPLRESTGPKPRPQAPVLVDSFDALQSRIVDCEQVWQDARRERARVIGSWLLRLAGRF